MPGVIETAAEVASGRRIRRRRRPGRPWTPSPRGDGRVRAFLEVTGERALDEARGGRPPGRGGRGSAAGGRAARDEGQHLGGRPASDLRLAHPGRVPSAGRLDGRGAPAAGRSGLHRAVQHGRVRHGLLDREQLLARDAEPLGPLAHPGRLLGRQRRGRGGPLRPGRVRLGHGGLDPAAGGLLRRRRPQADLRARFPLRSRGLRLFARPDRPAHAERRRRRPALPGRRRRRSARLDDGRRGRRRPRRRRSAAGWRGCGSVSSPRPRPTGLDPEVAEDLEKARRIFRDAGARIVSVSVPRATVAIAIYYVIASAEASSNLARFDGVRYGPAGLREGPRFALRREPDRGLRSGGQAADPARNVRAGLGLLRGVLRPGDARPAAPAATTSTAPSPRRT